MYVAVSLFAFGVLEHVRDRFVGHFAPATGPAVASVTYAVAVAGLGWFFAAALRRRKLFLRV